MGTAPGKVAKMFLKSALSGDAIDKNFKNRVFCRIFLQKILFAKAQFNTIKRIISRGFVRIVIKQCVAVFDAVNLAEYRA